MNRTGMMALMVVLALVFMSACGRATRFEGQKKRIGNGQAWSWTEYDNSGNLMRIGVTMTRQAMGGLPDLYEQVEVPLPDARKAPPYTTAVIGWDPLGHNPLAYSVPHFDFQFYFVRPEELGTIAPGSDTLPVPERFRPPDYRAALQEPSVGTHWGDTTAPEFHGKPFTATFVYGYENGQMIFIEPMVALSYATNRPAFSAAVKQPPAFNWPGAYPGRYTVKYDPRDSTVTVAMEGMTLIKAQQP